MPFPIFTRKTGVTFASVEGTAISGTEDSSQPSSFGASLPSGIQNGDLLLLFVAVQHATTARLLATPGGWTALYSVVGPGSLRRAALLWREATGSEGSSVNVSTGAGSYWACLSFRISGWSAAPTASTNTGTSDAPNPPNHSPGMGSYLWLALGYTTGSGSGFTANPSDYTDPVTAQGTASSGELRIRATRRELIASSEDPASYTTSLSVPWAASTVAIK